MSRIQTISGTGANHLGGLFLERCYGPWLGKSKAEKIIYISNPTWGESMFASSAQSFPFIKDDSMLTNSITTVPCSYPSLLLQLITKPSLTMPAARLSTTLTTILAPSVSH